MLRPDAYYETHLEGKTEKEILSVLRGLKNEIGRLKNIMEHPDFSVRPQMHPTEDEQIHFNRMYLERAKQALLEMGAAYTPSQAEQKAQQFQEHIDCIKKIKLVLGGYLSGYGTYTISIDQEHIHYNAKHTFMEKLPNLPNTTDYPMPKAEFLEKLRTLFIGEWRTNYTCERFGILVMDGIDWSLEFEYLSGIKPARYHGSNAYPYNFEKCMELFGINEYLKDALDL